MKRNVGTMDRTLRILAAIVVAALLLTSQLSGAIAIFLGIVAVLLLATSAIGFCPAYLPFKISTCGEKTPAA